MRMLFDPSPTNTIYVATNGGVFTGTHTASGITWTQLGSSFGAVVDMVIDFATSPPTIYASTEGGTIRKWDGTNWNVRTSGINTTNAARIALALSPADKRVLYARVSSTAGTVQGLYKTTSAAEQPEGGVAWNLDSAANANILDDSRFDATSGYAWWGNFLVPDPRNADVVYSGGVFLYKRTAAGWAAILTGPDSPICSAWHGDQHVVVLDPNNPDIVWPATTAASTRALRSRETGTGCRRPTAW